MNIIINPKTRLEGSAPWLSAPFSLANGKAAVITAYGLGEDDSFCVKHALIKSPDKSTHTSVECAVLQPDATALIATSPLIKCEKPICGSAEKPSVRLKMPGTYVLEFQGAGFAARQVTVAVDFMDAASLSDEYLACPEIDADKIAAVFMRCDGETRHVPNAQIPTCQEMSAAAENAQSNPSPNAVAAVFRNCAGQQHVPNAQIPTCQEMQAGLVSVAQGAANNDIYVSGGDYNATSVQLRLQRTNGVSVEIPFDSVRNDFTQHVINQITQGAGGTPTDISTAIARVFQNCAGVALTPNTRMATCADLQQGLANQQDLYAVGIIDHNPNDFTITFVRNDGTTWEADLSSVIQNAVGLFKDCNGQPLSAGAQLVSCSVFNQAISNINQQITNIVNNTPSQTDIFDAVVSSLEQRQNASDADYQRFIKAIVSGDGEQNIQGRDDGVYYGTTAPPETRVIYVDAVNGDDTTPANSQDMALNGAGLAIGNNESRPVKTIKRALDIGQPNVLRTIRLMNGQRHYITDGTKARGGVINFGIYGVTYSALESAHASSGSNNIFTWTQQVRDLDTYIDAGTAFDYTYPNGDVYQFGRSISMTPNTKIVSYGVNYKGGERSSSSSALWAGYFNRLFDADGDYEIELRNFKWDTNSANPSDYKALIPADRVADGTVFISDVEVVGNNTNAQILPVAKPPFNFTFENGQASAGTLNENTIDPWVGDTVKQNCVITNMVTNIPHDKLSPACHVGGGTNNNGWRSKFVAIGSSGINAVPSYTIQTEDLNILFNSVETSTNASPVYVGGSPSHYTTLPSRYILLPDPTDPANSGRSLRIKLSCVHRYNVNNDFVCPILYPSSRGYEFFPIPRNQASILNNDPLQAAGAYVYGFYIEIINPENLQSWMTMQRDLYTSAV